MKKIGSFGIAFLLLIGTTAGAQEYFGQNQVKYDYFDWQVLETDHFLVHYYPEMAEAASTAARLAEMSYARLSRVIGHQFRERKPLILFATRGHFGQNNVTGDLGEGTGGVTEALRHRVLLPFTGDFRSFERVLTHELVHSFQYDIFARGRAGGGLSVLQQVSPPLWFVEGMAEYLAMGPDHPLTDAWVRDAVINGRVPTIDQLTRRPDQFFPYRYGESVFQYIGSKWGDEAIGRILQSLPTSGVERAIRRELGISTEDLSEEWKEAMQVKYLPDLPERERPRAFAQQLLNTRRSGGAADLFLAPSLSNDGKRIAFLSFGSVARGEVFVDLWLGDVETGKRVKRLVKSTLDPDFEELRLLYSQSSFSHDGKLLAFTAMREGKDVLYLFDVERGRRVRDFDLPLDGVTSPAFSPDDQRIVFSGTSGGISNLYVVNTEGGGFRALTDDPYGDLQPQWSPDGRRVAFASERGGNTSIEELRFDKWRISVVDVETGAVETLPGQDGLNINPMWAPDGESVAFISDRTGTANIFLYDFQASAHYQLTNVVGAVSAITEFSPALTWARGADLMAFTYFDDGDYTVWSSSNPRRLKKEPFRAQIAQVALDNSQVETAAAAARAAEEQARLDSLRRPSGTSAADSMTRSLYRVGSSLRPTSVLPDGEEGRAPLSIAELLDNSATTLPDTTRFRKHGYRGVLEPEYISRPSIGYSNDNFGNNVYGTSALVLADMLGNHRMIVAGGLNGRVSDAQFLTAYVNTSRRLTYLSGIRQEPFYFYENEQLYDLGDGYAIQETRHTRYILRQAFSVAEYPFNRFSRLELGLNFTHVDRASLVASREVDLIGGYAGPFYIDRIESEPGVSYFSPMLAHVTDNSLFGYTGPIMGTRSRLQIQPAIGGMRWVEYLADYRRYDPIIFNFLTVATRFTSRIAVGRDEEQIPAYIGRPEFMRGYNKLRYSFGCTADNISNPACGASRMLGSRVAVANAELRFPVVRAFDLGLLPIALPPVDGLVFYDVGMAWSTGDQVSFFSGVPAEEKPTTRYPLRAYGYGIRLNLYGLALLRWDYAIPLDLVGRKGFWTFSIGPSF